MVGKLSCRGVTDWVAQRVTAVIVLVYGFFILLSLFDHSLNDQASWQLLFSHLWMKVFTLLALGSLFWHAWIGIWTILTDYIKCARLRLLLEILVIIFLVVLGLWALLLLLPAANVSV